MRFFCLDCAETASPNYGNIRRHFARRYWGLMILSLGAIIGVVVTSSDYIPGFDGTHPGVGYTQQIGIGLAVVAIIFGALFRIDFIAAGGSILLILAISADLLTINRAAGIGWKQTLAILLACSLILAGLGIHFRGYLRNRLSRATESKVVGG